MYKFELTPNDINQDITKTGNSYFLIFNKKIFNFVKHKNTLMIEVICEKHTKIYTNIKCDKFLYIPIPDINNVSYVYEEFFYTNPFMADLYTKYLDYEHPNQINFLFDTKNELAKFKLLYD